MAINLGQVFLERFLLPLAEFFTVFS